MTSPSDLFGTATPRTPRSRLRPAPRQLVLLIERHAQGLYACMPKRVEEAPAGRTCVATDLTYAEAIKLEAELRGELRTMLRARDNPITEDHHAQPITP